MVGRRPRSDFETPRVSTAEAPESSGKGISRSSSAKRASWIMASIAFSFGGGTINSDAAILGDEPWAIARFLPATLSGNRLFFKFFKKNSVNGA
jgi:hypothetical protein